MYIFDHCHFPHFNVMFHSPLWQIKSLHSRTSCNAAGDWGRVFCFFLVCLDLVLGSTPPPLSASHRNSAIDSTAGREFKLYFLSLKKKKQKKKSRDPVLHPMRDQPSCQCLQTQKKGNSPFVPAAHAELRSAPRRKHLRLAASASVRKTERPGAKMSDFFFSSKAITLVLTSKWTNKGIRRKWERSPVSQPRTRWLLDRLKTHFWPEHVDRATLDHMTAKMFFFLFFFVL